MTTSQQSAHPFTERQVRDAARFLLSQSKARRARRRVLWEQAEADARRILACLLAFRPRRVLQWGSVLNASDFSEISDIDFAIEGLDAGQFDKAFAAAEALTNFPLHLIRWETTPPEAQELILQKGKVVYERP